MTSALLFLALAVSSSLAIMVATPRQLTSLKEAGVIFPAPQRLAVIQGIILAVIGAGLGVVLQGSTGFLLLKAGIVTPTIVAALVGVLVHLILYYIVFRPRIPHRDVLLGEQVRLGMGLAARVLQGGITEEVQFRWGVMSVIAAITLIIFPAEPTIPMLVAIVVSALLFALFHLVGGRQIGLASSQMERALIIVDNTWGGIIFGWLFWQYGLAAAMIAHAIFHIVWYPVERWFNRHERMASRDG